MERATRHNEGKLRWSLVDFNSFSPMVKVLEFGAKKYGIDNWKKGLYTTQICESMLRHIFAYLDGENLDEDSGLSHIGHIQANSMFLGFMDLKIPQFDDRRQVIANIRLPELDDRPNTVGTNGKQSKMPAFDDRPNKVGTNGKQSKIPDHVIRGLIHHKKYSDLEEAEWITEQINEYKARRHTIDYDTEIKEITLSMDFNSNDIPKMEYLRRLLIELEEDREEVVKGLTDTLNLYTEKTYVESMGGAYNPPKDKRPFAPLFENHKPPKSIIE